MVSTADEVVAFLSQGASYGQPGAEVIRLETHCSLLFLVGERAYKLKRPVAFSQLDYRTLPQREAACRAELRLNRRTAPDLYLGVRAVRRRSDGRLGLDGEGAVLDWLVEMRRFDQDGLFDHLAQSGQITLELAAALAAEVAAFHRAAEPMPDFGGAEGLRHAIEQNRHDQEGAAPLLAKSDIEALHGLSLDRLAELTPLLDRRRDTGWVRRGHGDLRLANICLIGGRPTLFDAIEFSDRVSCIDILFDTAFLIVDLHGHGLTRAADIFFNRYLDGVGGEEGTAALPLMLSIRAGLRAYSLAASAGRRTRREEADRLAADAARLMAMALSLLDPARPRLIAERRRI